MSSTTRTMIVVELQAASARAKHALCGLLRGKGHCRGKLTDVTNGEETPILHRTSTQYGNSEDAEELMQITPRNWFHDKIVLEIGDPSRNVIEMIFRATTTDITRFSMDIKQVLKLNHPEETIERFKCFREAVKDRASKHYNQHPRNMADGNEQLMFYGTKLTCFKQFGTSTLCRDSSCSICSIMNSGFYTAKKKSGIWLSTSSGDLINANLNPNIRNLNMAIIVCRVITGRVIEMLDRDFGGEYDTIGEAQSNYMFVRNPSAILPCFVIILNCT